jgi:CHASE2 domain-containing sensor protein
MTCHSQWQHDNIVLINSGPYNKGELAKVLAKINLLNPRVVAIDIAFTNYDANEDDRNLSLALRNCRNLVMASTIEVIDEDRIYFASASRGEFSPISKKSGFVSALSDGENRIPREFAIWKRDFNGSIGYHFSVQVARSFDSLKTAEFVNKHPQSVDAYYKRGRAFKTFLSADVLKSGLLKSDIEGKIIMIGFLGPGDEDKFISPLNRNGKEPDMYGLEYLAHIVAQVLE